MKITIDLDGESCEQRARFAGPSLEEMLGSLRELVQAPAAEVVVRGGLGRRSVTHVVQRLEDHREELTEELRCFISAAAISGLSDGPARESEQQQGVLAPASPPSVEG
jgi:hypothetical protein